MNTEEESLEQQTRRKIVNCLRTIIDPDTNINIVDMGFIYRVEIVNNEIEIDYTLTTMGCPMAEYIEEDILKTMKSNFDLRTKLKLVWEPLWNIGFLSVDARIELGYPINDDDFAK